MGYQNRAGRSVFRLSVCAVAFLLAQQGVNIQAQTAKGVGSTITYEEFMRLDVERLAEAFRRVTPETQAMLTRTHAQRWLDANRNRLSVGQVSLVQEVIVFITPELYGKPQDATARKKEEELKSKLLCSIGHDGVTDAFTFLGRPASRSWSETVDVWLSWFSDCVLK